MAWLVRGAQVLASAEVLGTRSQRARGLLGRDGVDGAVVLPRCRWVHSLGMRFALDVAYLDCDGAVVKIARLRPHRLSLPVLSARKVIEADAGAFARWGLHLGDVIEVRD